MTALGAIPTHALCLECRLDADPRVDMALCFFASPEPTLRPCLENLCSDDASDEWGRARGLLARWAGGAPDAVSQAPFLFTAFDLDADRAAPPAPCLSVCVDPDFLMRRLGLPVPPVEPRHVERLTRELYGFLHQEPLPGACALALRACLDAPGVEPRHVSSMLGRRPAPLKLDLALPVEQLTRFLRMTAFAGLHGQEVADHLRAFVPWQHHVQLNYVLWPAGSLHLEMELCTARDADDPARRRSLLRTLTGLGLVTPEKAAVLGALVEVPILASADALHVACNWYLKVRFEAGVPLAAKAYVGLMPRRCAPGSAVLEA